MTEQLDISNRILLDSVINQKTWQNYLFNVNGQFPIQTVQLKPLSTEISPSVCNINIDSLVARQLKLETLPYSYFNYDYFKEGIESKRLWKNRETNTYEIPSFNVDLQNPLSDIIPNLIVLGQEFNTDDYNKSRLFYVSDKSQSNFATLKTTTLVDKNLWQSRKTLLDARDNLADRSNDVFNIDLIAYLYPNSNIREMDSNSIINFLDTNIQVLNNKIFEILNDMRNPAVYEAIFAYYLSKQVTLKLTPFHPLFYTSFRAYDNLVESPIFGNDIPIQGIVFEPIQGLLYDLLQSETFLVNDEDQLTKLMSIYAQIIFGVHLFQYLNQGVIVNNTETKLYIISVPTDYYIYYRLKYEDLNRLLSLGYINEFDYGFEDYFSYGADVYFAVPTYGYKVVLGNLSESKMVISGKEMKLEQKVEGKELNKDSRSVDLLSLHLSLVGNLENLISYYREQDYLFAALTNEIESCPPYQLTNNTINRDDEILNSNINFEVERVCGNNLRCSYIYTWFLPFIKDGTCQFSTAIPERLFRYMGYFSYYAPEDPCTIVYDLYPQ